MFCPKCGKENESGARFCKYCGHSIPQETDHPAGQEAAAPAGNTDRPPSKTFAPAALIAIAAIVVISLVIGIFASRNRSSDQVAGTANRSDLTEPADEPTMTPEPTLSPEEVAYEKAMAQMRDGRYQAAARGFQKLGDYQDAAKQCKEAKYRLAKQLSKKGKYQAAAKRFKALRGYKNSKSMYQNAAYRLAKSYYKKKKYQKAKSQFAKLGSYKQSKSYVDKCDINSFVHQTVSISEWRDTTDYSLGGDGVEMTVSWAAVPGASGYELNEGMMEGDWYNDTKTLTTTSYSTSFSDVSMLEARVRAYKVIGGKKYYTGWSRTAHWTADWY